MSDLIQLADDQKILKYECDYLTSPFDNYGSLMVALTVILSEGVNNSQRSLSLVCKLYPESKEYQEMFLIEKTFQKEVKMYVDVVPALIELQEELNIPQEDRLDVFVKCFGARLKDMEGEVEAAMVLENIKAQGYQMGSRSRGFENRDVEFILKKLALFHATPIALQFHRPKVFQEKILPSLRAVDLNDGLTSEQLKSMKLVSIYFMFHMKRIDLFEQTHVKPLFSTFQMLLDYIQSIPEISHLTHRIDSQIDFCREENKRDFTPESPFNSICHNDFWVNNMMLKSSADWQTTSLKILDFQLTKFSQVTVDLLFFLFTSVDLELLLSSSFDELLVSYHTELLRLLKVHQHPADELSFDKFLESLNQVAPGELYHLLVLLRVVHLDKGQLTQEETRDVNAIFLPHAVGKDFLRKLKFVILEYERRGWLIGPSRGECVVEGLGQ